jgi:hypothetical protein
MNGTCKLCGQTGLLRESHIIPDFYIRGLEHKLATGSQGVEQPFSTLQTTKTFPIINSMARRSCKRFIFQRSRIRRISRDKIANTFEYGKSRVCFGLLLFDGGFTA